MPDDSEAGDSEPSYSEKERRSLHVVRQFLSEEPPPADKAELFADDGIWWNGHPRTGVDVPGT